MSMKSGRTQAGFLSEEQNYEMVFRSTCCVAVAKLGSVSLEIVKPLECEYCFLSINCVSLKTCFCCNPVLADIDVATEKYMFTTIGEVETGEIS